MLFGEITTNATLDYQKIVRQTIQEIGYDDSSKGTYILLGIALTCHFTRDCSEL